MYQRQHRAYRPQNRNKRRGFSQQGQGQSSRPRYQGSRQKEVRQQSNYRSQRSSRFQRGGNYSRRPASFSGRQKGEKIDERRFINKITTITEKPEYVPRTTFREMEIDPMLKANVLSKNFPNPTPIQDQAIPHILAGKDLLGIAGTGTGKTIAFLLPLLQKILKKRGEKVLIVTPTRELADQINDELYALTRNLNIYSVKCTGGAGLQQQIYALRRGYNFIVGTPGRLTDLVDRRALQLGGFTTVVLDEVDRMLDMGFIAPIKQLISNLAKERQSLFFSATVSPKIEGVIRIFLKPNFERVAIKSETATTQINQDVIHAKTTAEKVAKLQNLLHSGTITKALIFVNTRRGVDSLEKALKDSRINAIAIHGDKRQSERRNAIRTFKTDNSAVLIATDVAARGLDIPFVSHVINFDVPMTYNDYVHRIGRTGRANRFGNALTFVKG